MFKSRWVSFLRDVNINFKLLNWIILLPILLWPFVFFSSGYVFDDFRHNWEHLLKFIALNIYPLYLFILFKVNTRIHKSHPRVGYLMPVTIGFALIVMLIKVLMTTLPALKMIASMPKIGEETDYIGKCKTYNRNEDVVYYMSMPTEADPKSFEYLSCHCGKDKNTAFFRGKPIAQSDAQTFQVLGKNQWQKDKFNFYYRGVVAGDADYDSFQILRNSYAKDKFRYYFRNTPIQGADYNSFEIISMGYAKDKSNYYYYGVVIRDTDYNSFKALPIGYSKDQYHVYYMGKIIKDADPATFEVNKVSRMAKDKNGDYKYGRRRIRLF